jgi:hypothetical protein
MLNFTDKGLAHLAIAATAVAPNQRRRWLKRIAAELDGHPPTATALRLRQYRAGQRNGQRVYRVVLDQVELEELLIAAQTLAPHKRDDHAAVEAALQQLLAILIADPDGNAFPPGRGMTDRVKVRLVLAALQKELLRATRR